MLVKILGLVAVALLLLGADQQLASQRAAAQLKVDLASYQQFQAAHGRIGQIQRASEVRFMVEKIQQPGRSVMLSWPSQANVTDAATGAALGQTPLDLATDSCPPRLSFSKPGYLTQAVPASTLVNVTLSQPLATRLAGHALAFLAILPLLGAAALVPRYRRQAEEAAVVQLEEELPEAPPPVGPGTKVGRYRLGRPLGNGAQAEVFLAHEEVGADPSRPFAIKILYPQVCQDPEYSQRFEREAEMCTKLTHPRVVRVYYSGLTPDKRWYMVQDFVPNGTLKSFLAERGALPPEEARRLLVQLAEGLAYAHSKGITHRDFKPENVLLDEENEPVIADFGMARAARYQTITREDTTLGTPAYMPPEQVKGERPDHRADLYSLGVVGYQMLTGRLPFEGDLITTMMQHMTAEPPPLPSELPEDLVGVVMRLLQKEPGDRYASAVEVRAALTRATGG